jgi:hypothetical protein
MEGVNRINVGLFLNPEESIRMNGNLQFHSEFMSRLQDYNKTFNEIFADYIEPHVVSEWGVYFPQISIEQALFFCDIYCDDFQEYENIKTLVQNKMPVHITIQSYYYKGNFAAYLNA